MPFSQPASPRTRRSPALIRTTAPTLTRRRASMARSVRPGIPPCAKLYSCFFGALFSDNRSFAKTGSGQTRQKTQTQTTRVLFVCSQVVGHARGGRAAGQSEFSLWRPGEVLHGPNPPAVRKQRHCFYPLLIHEDFNDDFTKTGSGQTSGKLCLSRACLGKVVSILGTNLIREFII